MYGKRSKPSDFSMLNVRLTREPSGMVLHLPSGRSIHFRGAHLRTGSPHGAYLAALLAKGVNPSGIRQTEVAYQHPRGYIASVFGGLLMDNVCQGSCRDLLGGSLVTFLADTVLHVHDEIVREVPAADADRELVRTCCEMSRVRSWNEGFPVKVEGFVGERYTKAALPGFATCTALEGRVI